MPLVASSAKGRGRSIHVSPLYNSIYHPSYQRICSGKGVVREQQLGLPDVQALELPTWKAGDINHDGCVNGLDLSILLGSWGPCTCPADINNDGIVDRLDLSIVLGNWGC